MNSKLSARDFVLLLLNSSDKQEIRGKLCFQKEMFVLVKEVCPNLDFELNFKPYRFGPFSHELCSLLISLKKDSLINISEFEDTYAYSITEKGVEYLDNLSVSRIVKKIHNIKTGSDKLGYKGLLRHVYFNYLEYTLNSIINKRVLRDNRISTY